MTENFEDALNELVAAGDADGALASGDFDFDTHRQKALDEYQPLVPLYADFARSVYLILRTCLTNAEIKVHSVDHRAKSPESFADKAARQSEENPNRPRYENPLDDITDLAGVRVITYFPSTEAQVDPIIQTEFEILEKTDRSELLEREERLGYHSIHYLVRLLPNRCELPEYARYDGLVAEVQVRTILQHAWAEIEHDIQYKAVSALPREIRRRFMTLAGLLEIADREFQAIADENARLREEARASVAAGRLGEVAITPDALKSYLDRRLGPDGRMTDFSYQWEAELLQELGFSDLGQLDAALDDFDDDDLSRTLTGGRQGQLSRLEMVLLAAMGEEFVARHPWGDEDWFVRHQDLLLRVMRMHGVQPGEFRPEEYAAPE